MIRREKGEPKRWEGEVAVGDSRTIKANTTLFFFRRKSVWLVDIVIVTIGNWFMIETFSLEGWVYQYNKDTDDISAVLLPDSIVI